jgi:hypothetical protein
MFTGALTWRDFGQAADRWNIAQFISEVNHSSSEVAMEKSLGNRFK